MQRRHAIAHVSRVCSKQQARTDCVHRGGGKSLSLSSSPLISPLPSKQVTLTNRLVEPAAGCHVIKQPQHTDAPCHVNINARSVGKLLGAFLLRQHPSCLPACVLPSRALLETGILTRSCNWGCCLRQFLPPMPTREFCSSSIQALHFCSNSHEMTAAATHPSRGPGLQRPLKAGEGVDRRTCPGTQCFLQRGVGLVGQGLRICRQLPV
jgi:hypothetical protein